MVVWKCYSTVEVGRNLVGMLGSVSYIELSLRRDEDVGPSCRILEDYIS